MMQCGKCLVESHTGCYESPRNSIASGFIETDFLEKVVPDLSLEEWGRIHIAEK